MELYNIVPCYMLIAFMFADLIYFSSSTSLIGVLYMLALCLDDRTLVMLLDG